MIAGTATFSRAAYPSDLSDDEWRILEPLIPTQKSTRTRGGRPAKYERREIVNGIRYVLESGCRWRDMPHDLPHWHTVWRYFDAWSRSGRWKRINRILRKMVRKKRKRNEDPSAAVIDSQTAKGVTNTGNSGYDAGKKTKGRKRHLLTDTQGLLLDVLVHAADIQDRDGAKLLLNRAATTLKTIEKIYADGGYAGKLIAWVQKQHDTVLEIVKRPNVKGFVLLAKRWVIERTNAWVSQARRLAKEYERTTRNQESMIYVRMIGLMLKWI